MFYILSDILHSLPIPNMSWCMALWGHGYPLHGLSSVHGVCVGENSALRYCPIVGSYPLIVRFSHHRYYTPIVG